MEQNSVYNPLLSSQDVQPDIVKKETLTVSLVKWILKTVMWIVFISWVAFIFFYPAKFVSKLFEKLIEVTNGTVFGITGLHLKLIYCLVFLE